MNEFEAQMRFANLVKGVLLSLYDSPSPDEEDAMGDVADLVIEALDVRVVSTDGTTALITVDLSDPE